MSPIANPESFHEEARYQRVCAVTGKGGGFQAHHVIEKQELKRRGLRGDELYDTRNALRLTVRAHEQHTHRVRIVRTKELTDDNVEYAFELLGAYAADYLRRYYDDRDPDPRIERALAAEEAMA